MEEKKKPVGRGEETRKGLGTDRSWGLFFAGILFLLIISIGILASVPPVSKDALVHHLAIPKLYLKHGSVYEIPSLPFSYYPMNLDLLYMIPLYFGNDILPKFIHFAFALLTGWLIYDYLRQRMNTIYSLLGAILFLSIPITVKLSITVYTDLGLVFFSTASLLFLLKWLEMGFRLKFLILSAIFTGLAMGTKYNGLITFFLLSLFVPLIQARYAPDDTHRFFRSVSYGVLFMVIALILFSPWMLRNIVWTSNPIFPLYEHWFNPQYSEVPKSVGPLAYRALIYNESWWQIALLPVRVFFQGQDGNPQYFDGELNPFLLLLPFFAFYKLRSDPQRLRVEKKIHLAFAFLFFSYAFFATGLRIRYLSPIVPSLVILSVFGIEKMMEMVKALTSRSVQRTGSLVVFLVVMVFIGLNVSYILGEYAYVAPFDYLSGRVSRDDYITKYRHEYPAMQYINRHLPSDALILFIFLGDRGYYCERRYLFDIFKTKSKLQQIVEKADDAEDVWGGLRDLGITHLLMNSDIFNRWAKESFDQRGAMLLREFFEIYTRLRFSQRGYDLYALAYPLSSLGHL